MDIVSFDRKNPLGGIVFKDQTQEIVELTLQPENDLPPYSSPARINIMVLQGKISVLVENKDTAEIGKDEMIILHPNEEHKIKILEKDTEVIIVKTFF